MKKFSRQGDEDGMITLCRFAVETSFNDIPGHVVDFAKRHILDQMGCIIGGSAQVGIREVVYFVKEKGGRPESPILFYGGRVPASEAAFAIGPMARAIDMGDVSIEASHTAEYTLPALLAAVGLKEKVSGREFITAFAVGQEVMIRIGSGFNLAEAIAVRNNEGGHFIFGPTVAIAKLLGLSLEETLNAVGIANAMTQHWEMSMYAEGALSVRVHHGFVCQDAVNACLLAQRGITGPHNILFGPKGFYAVHNLEGNPEKVTQGLGEVWKMKNTMLKPYAACKCSHAAINAFMDLLAENRVGPDDIEEVDAVLDPTGYPVVCEPAALKYEPRSVPECQFSLPYVLSVAAFEKRVFIDSYAEEMRGRKDIRQFMNRVKMNKDPSLEPLAARVRIKLKDGREMAKEVVYVKGHPENPLTDEELMDKFRWMVPYSALRLPEETVSNLISNLFDLDRKEDMMAALIDLITPND